MKVETGCAAEQTADPGGHEPWRSWIAKAPLYQPEVGWVVSRHAEVCAVLQDPRYVVPASEPGGQGGTLRWLRASVSRFCDGEPHARRRAIAEAEIGGTGMDPRWLRATAHQRAVSALDRAGPGPFEVMARLARSVPVGVLCSALGVGGDDLEGAVQDAVEVAAAMHPGAPAERRSRADGAVQRLTRLLGGGSPEASANRIGLLVQACDATAGLVGNALDTSLRLPASSVGLWPVGAILAETLRHNPPVWSTLRQTAAAVDLGGHQLQTGTTVLLHLAAANRDPAVFTDPHRFDPLRAGAQPQLTFGHGRRPCPGGVQALALAGGVVEAVLARCRLANPEVVYEPSANLRVPASLEVAIR